MPARRSSAPIPPPLRVVVGPATVSNGAYAMTSKAYDAAGNVGTSARINVTISNMTGSCTKSSQLLTNADFEAGDTGWTTSGGIIDNNDATNAHGGAWSAG